MTVFDAAHKSVWKNSSPRISSRWKIVNFCRSNSAWAVGAPIPARLEISRIISARVLSSQLHGVFCQRLTLVTAVPWVVSIFQLLIYFEGKVMMRRSAVRHVKWHPVASKWQTCPNFQLGIKWFQCWSHQQSRVKTCLCSVSVIPSSPSHSSARNKYSAFLAQMIVVSGMPFALGSDSWRGPDYKLGKAWLFHLKPVVSFVSPCWFISIKWLQ